MAGFKLRFEHIKTKRSLLWLLYAALAIFISARNYAAPLKDMPGFEGKVSSWNNYLIFTNSPDHLLKGSNLYAQYPAEQYDVFKYSPSFALLFTPFSLLPHWLGLACWNLLNMLLFVYAISKLNLAPLRQLGSGLLALPEAFTTTLNSQSNMLIAALLILAWSGLENGETRKPVVLIWITAFIKLFGLLFFALILLYPQRWKTIVPALISGLLIFLLPLPITGWSRLLQHYAEYGQLLAGDHSTFVKYSVMGWLQSWFGLDIQKNLLVLAGLFIQCLPLLFIQRFRSRAFRMQWLATWLIWVVIFNHMAESATFIIAVAGVFVWYFSQNQRKIWHVALLLPVMAFTCLGPSDIYPREWRVMIVEDLQLKVFPCILVWAAVLIQMMSPGRSGEPDAQVAV